MTTPLEELLPGTRRALLHRIAVAQSEGRAPSLVAAVVRDGRAVWHGARTCVDGHAPDENVQYRIGSITKTFTAVLVLRLRDEGALDLSDVLGDQPALHPPGRRFHYSNPGYSVLGALVEELRGAPWEEVLRREVLEPLSLDRTSARPVAPQAGGWAVHPWADVMLPEPAEDFGRMAAAGQLWSTSGDLARFAAFLVRGDDRVLSAETLKEMRTPAAPAELTDLVDGGTYGLGMRIENLGGRVLVGHSGSVPGFLAGLTISVADDVAAVVLANCTSGPMVTQVAADLVRIVAEAEPRIPEPWRPLRDFDRAVLELAGQWCWGTSPFALRVTTDGDLSLEPLSGGGRRSRFRTNGDGTWTGLEGYFAGETLRAVRRPDGAVDHLDLGSFVFTRQPYDEQAEVPGGVDAQGWRGIG
ncbi:beta-lactamase family protein [Streptomyces phaeoluteigriseus]|uniref:Beta-lactamase family protein n=1 Tax=Streptomyces phaeoluteigriseus TaxID=114686 RepID=A0ABY4ZJQ8_9ACTN|nr:serine hydrolase domain-containing protein [Streptomyces phaeoluteigriseus]USQ89339.1 beta-lactamase family protein [Streptomyces phaeoluteigriseus]